MLRVRSLLLLLGLCAALFWWRLGAIGLIDPDEPFYAETAREMVDTNDWITPRIFGQPQFEKPIAFYWMAAGCFKIFGINEWAARAPSAFFATLLVLLVYAWGAKFWNERTGLIAALVLGTGVEFVVMSRLMLTDIALAFFIAAALFSYWLSTTQSRRANLWLLAHFAFAALAVLTKGPLASLICAMAIGSFLFVTRTSFSFRNRWLWIGASLYAVIAFPWYVLMLCKYGRGYFDAFFVHENFMRLIHAEHPTNNHFYYYIAILLLGSVPWMPALGLTLRRAVMEQKDCRAKFLWCWILTSFVFLTVAQSKLPSYSFFLFAPFALVTAKALDDLLKGGFGSRGEKRFVLSLGLVQFALILACPFFKIAKPFAAPALLVSICLAAALVLQWRGEFSAWLAAQVAATLALIASGLTLSLPNLEVTSSARPIALALKQEHCGHEPILTDKFLARGIFFYTQEPVRVLASKPQPFWSAHPLPIVVGRIGLRDSLRETGTAICAVRQGESPLWTKLGVFAAATETEHFGNNLLIHDSTAQLKNY
jgi:4-amino-4-deoxy-L-arabinose transferase-like glycosyltransferase